MQAMTKAKREDEEETGFWDYVEAGLDWLELACEVGPAMVGRLVTGAFDALVHACGAAFELLGAIFEVLAPLLELLACLGG